MRLPDRPQLTRALAWAAALASALAVLMLYTRPEFLVMVADQVWACF
jgi:hypothetical protein